MSKKAIINTALWIILFLFLLPSSLAVASWNSLPGSHLYGVKLAMEQALVFVVPSYQTKGTLQIAYTERRFADATNLLADRSSTQGLSYLDTQMNVTKQAILAAPDPVVKRQLATQYTVTLQSESQRLEQQRQTLVSQQPRMTQVQTQQQIIHQTTIINNTTVVYVYPTPANAGQQTIQNNTNTVQPPTPTPAPQTSAPTNADINSSVSDTITQINNTIGDMNQITGATDNGGSGNGQNHGNNFGSGNQGGNNGGLGNFGNGNDNGNGNNGGFGNNNGPFHGFGNGNGN